MLWEQNSSYVLLWSRLNFIYFLQTVNPLPERQEDKWVLWNFLESFFFFFLMRTNLEKKEISNHSSGEIIWVFWLFDKCLIPFTYNSFQSHPIHTHLVCCKCSLKDKHLNLRHLVIIQMENFLHSRKYTIHFDKKSQFTTLCLIYFNLENLCVYVAVIKMQTHSPTHSTHPHKKQRK